LTKKHNVPDLNKILANDVVIDSASHPLSSVANYQGAALLWGGAWIGESIITR